MKLKGANLGEKEVSFGNLSSYDWNNLQDKKELIKYLENLYYNLLNKNNDYEISYFPTKDGKAIIFPFMINHKCSSSIDALTNISKYGVLASEWFGILESEEEGRFCSFISRMKKDDYKYKGDIGEDNQSRLNIGSNVILFFDENNPVMKYLLHLDYFEYEHIKQTNKENIVNLYTKEEIELFDKLIEPLSPGGKNMRKDYDYKTNYWSSIPGGIPSFLINGICTKKNNYSEEELDMISDLFPNATVFNNTLDVLRYSKNRRVISKR